MFMVLEMHRNTSSGVLEDTAPTLLSEEVVSRLKGDLGDQSKSVILQDRNSTDTFPSPQPSGTVISHGAHLTTTLPAEQKEQTHSPPSISAPGCPQGTRICQLRLIVTQMWQCWCKPHAPLLLALRMVWMLLQPLGESSFSPQTKTCS